MDKPQVFEIPVEEVEYEVVKMGSGLAVKMNFCIGADDATRLDVVSDMPLFPLSEGSKFSFSKHARFVVNSPWPLDELKAKLQDGKTDAYSMGCNVKMAGVSFSKDYLVILDGEVNKECGEDPPN
jgi:hypothetical protein